MSRSGFLNKVPGQGIFFGGGKQVDLLSWLCFFKCLLLPFFAFFLHCSPILMTHRKIFHVSVTLKSKVVFAAAVELANLRSFKCVGISPKIFIIYKNVIVMLMRL